MVVAGASATNGVGRSRAGWTSAGPIDLDVASAAEIEALPRIGPALAARIIRSRDSLGPFGSLQGLRRVRGIGPAMLRELGPLVTFSGRAASFDVQTRY
jgi:competence protein ComEA